MPSNIVIAEGGRGRYMTNVARLATDLQDSTDKALWVPSTDRLTGTKFITANGTYRAADDGLHSWSKVRVSIPGRAGGNTVPTEPDDATEQEIPTGADGVEIPTPPANLDQPTTDTPDMPNPDNPDDVKKQQPQPSGGSGSSITGTGENGEKVVITDNGERKVVPNGITIAIPPLKTAYRAGEAIDYTGMIVWPTVNYSSGAYEPFIDEGKWPFHYVPIDELIFPVKTANTTGGTYIKDSYGIARWKLVNFSHYYYISGWGYQIVARYNNGRTGMYHSKVPVSVYAARYKDGTISRMKVVDMSGIDRTTNYYLGYCEIVGGSVGHFWWSTHDEGSYDDVPLSESAPSWPPSNPIYTVDIPVEWKSPYDGMIYGSTFSIDVELTSR